jgi:hypothetical protein
MIYKIDEYKEFIKISRQTVAGRGSRTSNHVMDQPPQNKRRYYRLQYPEVERPSVWFKGRCYEVTEVSEGGVMVLLGDGCAVRPGQSFVGVIEFQDGETNSIVGVVLRIVENKMAVKLAKGISLRRMMAEQIRLRKKYPMLFESKAGEGEAEST